MRENFPKIFSFWKNEKRWKREKTNLTIDHHNMVKRENLSYLLSILFENITFISIEKCFFLLRVATQTFFENRVKWWFGIFITMVNHYFESGGFSSQTIFRKEISSQILKIWLETRILAAKISYPLIFVFLSWKGFWRYFP